MIHSLEKPPDRAQDVANHQIRAFRVALIEGTIPFLQRYLLKRIAMNELNVEESKLWYSNLQESINEDLEMDDFRPVAVMFCGLVEFLLRFEKPRSFPQTFYLDSGRLWLLRADIQRLIIHDICWHILDHLIRNNRCHSSRIDIYSAFWSRLWPLLKENDHCPQAMTCEPNIGNVALELACIGWAACGRDIYMVSDDIIASIETTLKVQLSKTSDLFRRIQATLREKLLRTTFSFARRYLQMSPVTIYESQRRRRHQSRGSTSYLDELDAIAMRLAHMGAIHWGVWGPLVYEVTIPLNRPNYFPEDTINYCFR
jgi:T-complex protein 11